MSAYATQLTDRRWEEVRQRILRRDGGRCVVCGSADRLNVHHRLYREGRAAWEYRAEDLVTLCSDHHRKAHGLPVVKVNPVEIPDANPEVQAAKEDIRALLEQIRATSGPEAAVLFEELLHTKRRLEDLQRDAS